MSCGGQNKLGSAAADGDLMAWFTVIAVTPHLPFSRLTEGRRHRPQSYATGETRAPATLSTALMLRRLIACGCRVSLLVRRRRARRASRSCWNSAMIWEYLS